MKGSRMNSDNRKYTPNLDPYVHKTHTFDSINRSSHTSITVQLLVQSFLNLISAKLSCNDISKTDILSSVQLKIWSRDSSQQLGIEITQKEFLINITYTDFM